MIFVGAAGCEMQMTQLFVVAAKNKIVLIYLKGFKQC